MFDANGDSVLVESVAEVFSGGNEFGNGIGCGIGGHNFSGLVVDLQGEKMGVGAV